MNFFVGLDCPFHAQNFEFAFISINRIRNRKGPFKVKNWIMDSGAFTEIRDHGRYRHSIEEYAAHIRRWKDNGKLLAAVSQDYMCEQFILDKTGMTVAEHQRLTIERYDGLVACDTGVYIMPVLQGYAPEDYVRHIREYGGRLAPGAWVGVGSVCKRNVNVASIEEVLLAIHAERPDLRLHGFGIKITALASGIVDHLLYSADSMAWSFSARKKGRDNHDWREAKAFVDKIVTRQIQRPMFIAGEPPTKEAHP